MSDSEASQQASRSSVIASLLTRAPQLTPRQWRVLIALGAASFFFQYNDGLYTLVLRDVQNDLVISDNDVAQLSAIVRMGAVAAIILLAVGDRLGRRRVLLLSVVSSSLLTGASGLAAGADSFVAYQSLARIFDIGGLLLVVVIIAEELAPEARGWGIGTVIGISLCGRGFSLILFSLVDWIPFGWRALYAVGLLPLLWVPVLRGSFTETALFEDWRGHMTPTASFWSRFDPLRGLVQTYPARLAATAVVTFLHGFSNVPVDTFMVKYVQEVHGWAAWEFAVLGLFGGVCAVVGNAYAGHLSDRYGRKTLAVFALILEPLFALGFYWAEGWLVSTLWIGWLLCSVAGDVLLGAFAAEMFPTSHRATAVGAAGSLSAFGGVCGLAAEGALYSLLNDHWPAIRWLASTGLLMAIVVRAAYPETSRRHLQEISPER